jgi:uncharacterized protein
VRIWIDLSNSPHPLLFAPVARRLEALGHVVLVTARDNAQTVELTRDRWPQASVIGGPSPPGRLPKVRSLVRRVDGLRRWAEAARPDAALCHGSYAQIVAARWLRIPAVTAGDYEHNPSNHLAWRLAGTVLLPTALADCHVWRQGATRHKTRFYPGLKEELYLADFERDPGVVERLGIVRDGTLVVARPAPDRAVYHPSDNPLFLECLKAVLADPRVTVVVLPRYPEQRRALAELELGRCFIPEQAVDSRSLMSEADLMIGAGGTMTREAALMGVPTFSLFAGRPAAVDRWLEQRGLMRLLRSPGDLDSVERRPHGDRMALLRERGATLVEHFCDAVTTAAGSPAPRPTQLPGISRTADRAAAFAKRDAS